MASKKYGLDKTEILKEGIFSYTCYGLSNLLSDYNIVKWEMSNEKNKINT